MKNSILLLAAAALITGATITSCSSPNPAEKVEDAQKEVNEANKNLDQAKVEYVAEINNYRKETDAKAAANDKLIADLKANIAIQKATARAEYEKEIAALEQKNAEMKKKMDDYKDDGKENWEKFKAEFNHDMDGLGNAFKDLAVKNVK